MIEPYWKGRYSTIYHGSCFDIMPEIGVIDLLIIDGPYGKDYQSGRREVAMAKIADDSGNFNMERLGDLCNKVIRRYRHGYIFGFRPDELPASFRLGSSCELVWDKQINGMGDLTSKWSPRHEIITFGVFSRKNPGKRGGYGELAARLRSGSVLSFPRQNNARAASRHPNEKPVPLLRYLVESSSNLGETVLDPVCGSGSSIVAAIIEGRRGIGIELEEANCRISAERLAAAEDVVSKIRNL
jgi:DNA modification methylase